MAFIARFEERPLEPQRVHDSVVCGYRAVDIGGQRILQLETYGTERRKKPGAISQSIQVDRPGASELKLILERAFADV
jgi:hypothetical protein